MVDDTAQQLLGGARSFWQARVLLSMAELGLFARLGERWWSLEELIEQLHASPRALQTLLDAAAGQGWIDKSEGAYRVPARLQPYLSVAGAQSVLPMLEHMAKLWHDWSALSRVVAPHAEPSWASDDGHTRAFIGAMHVVSQARAPELVRAVAADRERRLLDIGGASGTYVMAFLREHPGMEATLFDLPEVVALAGERLEQEGLLARVRLVGGDYNRDQLPEGPHDLALLSAIVHQNDPEQNERLYRKVYDVLAPGGRLIIRDHVLEPDRTSPPAAAIFAVNMLVATEGGGCYTFEELRDGLLAAGFQEVELLERDERMNGLVEARK